MSLDNPSKSENENERLNHKIYLLSSECECHIREVPPRRNRHRRPWRELRLAF